MSEQSIPEHRDQAPTSGSSVRLRVDNGTHSGAITRMQTVPGAGIVVTAGTDKRIRAWSGPDPTLVRTMIGDIGPGRDGEVHAMAVQPGSGLDGPKLWAAIRRPALEPGRYYSELRLFDVFTGELLFALKMPLMIYDLVFTADGYHLITVDEQNLELYDVGGVGVVPDVQPTLVASAVVREDPMRLASTSHNGIDRIFITSIWSSQPRIVDFDGERMTEVPFVAPDPRPHRPDQVAVSSRHLAVANHDGGDLWIYDLDGTALQPVPDAGGGNPSELAFSPDGRLLIVGSKSGADSVVTVHDVERDFVVVNRRGFDEDVHAVGFLDDQTVVSAGGSRSSIVTWPAPTISLRPADTDEPEVVDRVIDGAGQVITAVGIDSPKVALGFGPRRRDARGELSVRMDLESLALQPIDDAQDTGDSEGEGPGPESDQVRYRRAERSDGHQTLRMAQENGHDTNLILEPFGLPMTGHGVFGWDFAESYGLLSTGQVAIGERSGAVRVLRWDEQQVLRGRKLIGHVGPVLDLASDDRWLVTGGRDQVMRFWYLPDAIDERGGPNSQRDALEPALNLFVSGREWVMWSKSGYYASSAEGERFISFHANRGFGCQAWAFPADRFVELLYRPDIIRAVYRTGSEDAALAELGMESAPLRIDDHLPPVVEIRDVYEAEPYLFSVDFTVVDLARPTTRVWVLQDGLIEWEHGPLDSADTYGESTTLSPQFWLEPGRNQLRILAESATSKSIAVDVVVEIDADGHLVSITDPTGAAIGTALLIGTESSVGTESSPVAAEPDISPTPASGWASAPPATPVTVGVESGWIDAVVAPAEPFEPFEPFEIFEGEPSVHLVDAEVVACLDVESSDSHRYLDATVNGESVWAASIDPAVAISVCATIPLPGGNGSVRITEASNAGIRTAFSADIGAPVLFDDWDGGEVEVGDVIAQPAPPAGFGPLAEVDPEPLPGSPLASGPFEAVPNPDPVPVPNPDSNPDPAGSGPTLLSSRVTGSKGDDDESSERPRRPTRVPPKLFMLSVGVSEMKEKDQSVGDLRFAADDAVAVANRFKSGSDGLFDSVQDWLLTDADATKANIESARDQLVAAVNTRSQQKRDENLRARDVVVLFFSGHGVTRPGGDGEPDDFYLVTHDFIETDAGGTGTLFADLVKPFFTLRDFELVVLVDACRSGRAGLAFIDRVDPEELAKRLKAPSEQAQHFLCSTSGDQVSWERPLVYPYNQRRGQTVGHGLFTHAIIKQMDEASTVSMSGLANGVGEALYLWTLNWSEAKLQEPTHYLYGGGKYLRLYRRR